jgi:hypothetical protein
MPEENHETGDEPGIDDEERHPREIDGGEEDKDRIRERHALPLLHRIEKMRQAEENRDQNGARRGKLRPPRGIAPRSSNVGQHAAKGIVTGKLLKAPVETC